MRLSRFPEGVVRKAFSIRILVVDCTRLLVATKLHISYTTPATNEKILAVMVVS